MNITYGKESSFVDTAEEHLLLTLKKAGFRWISCPVECCRVLGVTSASATGWNWLRKSDAPQEVLQRVWPRLPTRAAPAGTIFGCCLTAGLTPLSYYWELE